MTKVSVTVQQQSHVTYKPVIRVKFHEGDGATPSITWDHPDLMKGLCQMFGVRGNETITSIEVTEEGISANIITGKRVPTWK